jgi:hypothetical protein
MANQFVNKLIKDGVTKFDLTGDTVTAATLKSGYTAHNAAGQQITGTMLSQSTTVTAATLKSGYTAYRQNGTRVTGTLLSQNTTATADKILKGYTAYNQAGTLMTGTADLTSDLTIKFTSDTSTIFKGMFYNQPQGESMMRTYPIEEVVIGEGIIKIDKYAFWYCETLKSVKLPNTLTSIEDQAFYQCVGLTEIILPNGIKYLWQGCFNNCTGLTEITIPSSISYIEYGIFGGCTNLKNITINKPQGSISGAPWGATNATVVWTG